MRLSLLLCISLLNINALFAETWMNSLFSDGMVLQRNTPIKVWGTDLANQTISVDLDGSKAETKADSAGNWSLTLQAREAGGPYQLSVKGSNEQVIKDVYLGEVWLCSGQSNMAFPLKWLKDNPDNPQTATLPSLRLFKVKQSSGGDKANDVSGRWQIADGDIGDWSATAFHFGTFLQEQYQVPVGLINSSVGGTPIESWIDHSTLDQIKSIQGHIGWINGQVKKYPQMKKQLDDLIAKWTAGGKKGKKPSVNGMFPPNSNWRPAGLFNHMIAPIVGYSMKGAIWYQGESNVSRFKDYSDCLNAMITDWRAQWGIGDFPFLTVQLANHKAATQQPGPSQWAGLREAQNDSLQLANTGVAVIIDIGEAKDIHPKNKKDVGYRLALQAQHLAYSDDLIYSGPTFKAAKIEGNNIRVSFDHIGGGLKAKGDKLTAFEIAGADKKFVWANATIDGNDVIVSASNIDKPAFVRYGWSDNPACNLYNEADLPASPFRSDR